MDTELIIVKEIYRNSRIEPRFINLLEAEGLVRIEYIDGEQYIKESYLRDLNRFANLYYDLSINIEGIDVVNNLLKQMDSLKKELYILKKQVIIDNDNWVDLY